MQGPPPFLPVVPGVSLDGHLGVVHRFDLVTFLARRVPAGQGKGCPSQPGWVFRNLSWVQLQEQKPLLLCGEFILVHLVGRWGGGAILALAVQRGL